MAINKRQQICTAIDTALRTIQKSVGYETDLGNHVFEWRSTPLEEGELPALIWRDTDEPVEDTIGAHLHRMVLEVELLAAGNASPATLRKMIADVVTLIGANLTWGGLAEDTKPQIETIAVDQESRRLAGASLKFEILYTTGRFNPYL